MNMFLINKKFSINEKLNFNVSQRIKYNLNEMILNKYYMNRYNKENIVVLLLHGLL